MDEQDSISRIKEAIGRTPNGMVYNVNDNPSRATIDFATDAGDGRNLYQRARGGRFGSSLVVDIVNGEVITATLRYGDLGLPEDADLNIAKVEIEQLVKEADPPTTTSSISDDAGIFIRFRDMAAFRGDTLRREGDDIVHVVVNERMAVDEFVDWFVQFSRLMDSRKGDIRERVRELGADI